METPHAYEQIRQKRLEENRKRLEGLGLAKLSEDLSNAIRSSSKTQSYKPRPRDPDAAFPVERRSSARISRLPERSYREADLEPRFYQPRKRGPSLSQKFSQLDYSASEKARTQAILHAQRFVDELDTAHPFFIKPMIRSHVSSCFWLGLPNDFCTKYLPKGTVTLVLEYEGIDHEVVYIGSRTGISGGWRGFALEHGLNDGDAIIFLLVKPTKFKVYIFKSKDFEPKSQAKSERKDSDAVEKANSPTEKSSRKGSQSEEQRNKWSNNQKMSSSRKKVKKPKSVKLKAVSVSSEVVAAIANGSNNVVITHTAVKGSNLALESEEKCNVYQRMRRKSKQGRFH